MGLLCGLGAGSVAQAQPPRRSAPPLKFREKPIWAVGVCFAAPEDMVGMSVFYVPPEKLGGYGSLWLSTSKISDDPNYLENVTEGDLAFLNGDRVGEESQWGGVRFGLTRRLGVNFFGYTGVGLMRSRNYIEFSDPNERLTFNGRLWLDDPSRNDTKLMIEAGVAFYSQQGIAILIGVGTAPGQISVGLGFGRSL